MTDFSDFFDTDTFTYDPSDEHDHQGEACPDCGGVHPNDGLGKQFIDMVVAIGFDHPVSRSLIRMGLSKRGVDPDTIDFDGLGDTQVKTLIHNLALGSIGNDLPVADWTPAGNQASLWLAKRIIEKFTEVSLLVRAIVDTDGIALRGVDAVQIMELADEVGQFVGSTAVFATNPLNPKPNVDLTWMDDADFVPVQVGKLITDIAGGDSFRVNFQRKVDEVTAKTAEWGEKIMAGVATAAADADAAVAATGADETDGLQSIVDAIEDGPE